MDLDDGTSLNKPSLKTPPEPEKGNGDDKEPYDFPFKPYDIQLKLMKAAYDTYESCKFALLESPTGTGKSLSLICSAFTWLRDHQTKVKKNLEAKKEELLSRIEELKKEEDASGDWLSTQTKRQDVNRELAETNKNLDLIIKFEQKRQARWHAKLHNTSLEFVADIDLKRLSDNANNAKKLERNSKYDLDTSGVLGGQENSILEEEAEEDIEKKIKDYAEEDSVRPKIYYASRTHSQLSQFINEVKRTKFADVNSKQAIKLAPLASRANLCVNPEVLKLKDSGAINERCMEMQRETNAEKKCPFIKGKQVNLLKEEILSSVQDIEDIVSRGRVMGSCAYYAARMAIPEAEVVVLPYNNLLHHETRKASSLDLKDSIVIIDEAHNILETICSIHSAPITGQQLIGSHSILSRYYERFHARMTTRNAEIIRTIIECLTALIRYLNDPKAHIKEYDCPKVNNIDMDSGLEQSESDDQARSSPEKGSNPTKHEEFVIDVAKFTRVAKMEAFNIFKIIDYFNRSQLARKLIGLFKQDNSLDLNIDLKEDASQENNTKGNLVAIKKRKISKKQPSPLVDKQLDDLPQVRERTSLQFLKKSNPTLGKKENANIHSYPFYILVEFFKSLTNLCHDGKVLTDYFQGDILQSVLKFVLLNPSSQFKQMTEEARSVVLAGGTMQPFEEFTDLLFGPLGIERTRMTLFSCGHVIGPDQLYVASLTSGSTGKPLELSYKTRSSFEALDEIGRTIANISNMVPGGMVCFLPSYEYEQLCFNRWSHLGIIRNVETKTKQVFREPRQASHVKPTLDEYARVIEKGRSTGRGAMLMCVVGGKMSEGINFNDDLGRCVVMVGLPYANVKSSELQQKMSYYDKTLSRPTSQGQPSAGQQYYENLCIKGVNQSIGRAVRHKDDYAAIILLDRRYSSKTSIKSGLPGWIQRSLTNHERFGPMLGQLKNFFRTIEEKQR